MVLSGLIVSLLSRGILVPNPQLIDPNAVLEGSGTIAKIIELVSLIITLFVYYSKEHIDSRWIGGSTGAKLSMAVIDIIIEIQQQQQMTG